LGAERFRRAARDRCVGCFELTGRVAPKGPVEGFCPVEGQHVAKQDLERVDDLPVLPVGEFGTPADLLEVGGNVFGGVVGRVVARTGVQELLDAYHIPAGLDVPDTAPAELPQIAVPVGGFARSRWRGRRGHGRSVGLWLLTGS
jgi:hypothetical protein